MSKDLFGDVGEFHAKFGLDTTATTAPHFPLPGVVTFRQKFMQEELNEFATACAERDLAGAADAIADLVVVALGTAHLMGIPFAEVWDEVQRANMQKERALSAQDPRSKRKHSLDVVKPQGWLPPDHGPALEAARAAHDCQV